MNQDELLALAKKINSGEATEAEREEFFKNINLSLKDISADVDDIIKSVKQQS
jgi:hypothetical protein